MAGAPVGNQNAAKSRMVEQMLRKAAVQEDWTRLKQGIERVWDAFAAGEQWAVQFVRDTMDGKPAQQIIATDEEGKGLAIGLIAYSVRPDDTVQVRTQALPAPDTTEAGQRH